MIGMNMKSRRCGECAHINYNAYGKTTPVCYEVSQREGKPEAVAVQVNDMKRAGVCPKFSDKSLFPV